VKQIHGAMSGFRGALARESDRAIERLAEARETDGVAKLEPSEAADGNGSSPVEA
jgi:hypothetical protein